MIMDEVCGWLMELCLLTKPKTIIELGIESGNSTRVFLQYADIYKNTNVKSIDIDPNCANYVHERYERIIADDVKYASTYNGEPIDLLFVDTSHLYEHTKNEIAAYRKLMSPNGIICFHDTNIYKGPLYNSHGIAVGIGWDNERGVIKAIEEAYNTNIDETKALMAISTTGHTIIYKPWSGGFTIVC